MFFTLLVMIRKEISKFRKYALHTCKMKSRFNVKPEIVVLFSLEKRRKRKQRASIQFNTIFRKIQLNLPNNDNNANKFQNSFFCGFIMCFYTYLTYNKL